MIDATGRADALPQRGLRSAANRLARRPIATLLIISALLVAPAVGDWCLLAPDSIAYLTAARSLYETGHFPGHFLMRPPGFPVALAPLMAAGPLPLLGIRLLLAGCHVATGVLVFTLYQGTLGKSAALLVGLLTVTNTALLNQTTVALSEMVFVPVQLMALMAIDRLQTRGEARTRCAIAGILTGVAIMVRTIGLALVPTGLLLLWLRAGDSVGRRFLHAAIFIAAAGALPMAWHVRQSAFPEAGGYGRMWKHPMTAEQTDATGLSLQIQRLAHFGYLRLEDIKSAMLPNRLGWRAFEAGWSTLATIGVSGVLISMLLYRGVRLRQPMDIYAIIVLTVLAFWPWDEGARLVLPLVPMFYGALLWLFLNPIFRQRRTWRIAAVACVVVIASAQFIEWTINLRRLPEQRAKADRQLVDMREFGALLARIVPADADLLCITPNHHNSKRLIAGATYIARLDHVSYRDVLGDESVDFPADSAKFIILEQSLRDRFPAGTRLFKIAEFQDLDVLKIEAAN
ncbi:MAG TPA: hypothetical protein VNT79_01230 [Phycisphaerae bacterium]|nr:hypothetical protein [Phycisphaerae bacterium]